MNKTELIDKLLHLGNTTEMCCSTDRHNAKELAHTLIDEYLEAINYTRCCTELPTKEEMHLELNNRVEDIKATSSMGSNKQMLLAYRIGFEECDDYMRKR
jgi:hypothetical protein